MAIGTIADDTIDPGHEQESAPGFPQLGVLEEAKRRPGFPGSELAWAPDCSSLFALTTLWESTGACLAWQTQQLLPVPRRHPDSVGLGQPGTADILEVEPGQASAHATSSSGQVAATPTLTRRTAARRTAIKANLRGSRLLTSPTLRCSRPCSPLPATASASKVRWHWVWTPISPGYWRCLGIPGCRTRWCVPTAR